EYKWNERREGSIGKINKRVNRDRYLYLIYKNTTSFLCVYSLNE
uniref:Uncharacterized protein n=1 Tax=Parascaris equorum TaxID=6256 RepID=A0A914R452_PAREQ